MFYPQVRPTDSPEWMSSSLFVPSHTDQRALSTYPFLPTTLRPHATSTSQTTRSTMPSITSPRGWRPSDLPVYLPSVYALASTHIKCCTCRWTLPAVFEHKACEYPPRCRGSMLILFASDAVNESVLRAPCLTRYRRSVGEVALPILSDNARHLSRSCHHHQPRIPLGKLYKSRMHP